MRNPDARKLATLHRLTRILRDSKSKFEGALAIVIEEGNNQRAVTNNLLDIYDQVFPQTAAKNNGRDVAEKPKMEE